ncbi:unnamed protein product [Arctia plantaginis]|uniref:NEDD8 ultimate buster 1 n=1 Tax=Arctia plantaginis TaxID=874455 RepID=A0A8S0ZZA5_ARCPL|nr:unnamed protein product [Arctia plantaginis]
MDTNLQHEDLLIKLRAKLNEEKIKLWESPYNVDNDVSESLKDLSIKYSNDLSLDNEVVLQALRELQIHSIERSKANEEFKETGCATFRVKATIPGLKPRMLKIQKQLQVLGSELMATVASEIDVAVNRVKLIVNGKVIKATATLEEQGVKNGAMIMALVMAESPEEVKKEDTMYMEMKTVRDDAMLLSEYVDDMADDDDEYMRLEDQSGKVVELPPAERRSLLVGLALHERGRAAARQRDYALALVLLLEADRQFSECRSSILKSVDNLAVLQLDVSWCYLCLQSLPHAGDAAARLATADAAFKETYGVNHERLIALKGSAANERVLIMRLHLLQGIVAYHQNKRAEAKMLLEKAENELNELRVDESAVLGLMELGWSRGAARAGLRAQGCAERAHHYLAHRKAARDKARDAHRQERQRRLLGVCMDGSAVNQELVEGLVGMGYTRRLAATALRNSNNHVAEAVRLIQEQPELLQDTDESSDESKSHSSEESLVEPDNKLVAELEMMGYEAEEARAALRLSRNHISGAVDRLVACQGHIINNEDSGNPSTSAGSARKKQKFHKNNKRKEREQALRRLTSTIKTEEDDYLDTSLIEEEEYLQQYKSLL